jgi:hypothetical protein
MVPSRDIDLTNTTLVVVSEAVTAGALLVPNSVSGPKLSCVLAAAASASEAVGKLFIALHAAGANEDVRCTEYRILTGQDTSAGVAGGPVFLSGATPGGITVAAPDSSAVGKRKVGIVLTVDASTGQVLLAPNIAYDEPAAGLGLPVASPIGATGAFSVVAPGVYYVEVPNNSTAITITVDAALQVMDAEVIKMTAIGGVGDVVDITNGSGNIFPQFDLNTVAEDAIVRPVSRDTTNASIASGGTIVVDPTAGGSDVSCRVLLTCIRA